MNNKALRLAVTCSALLLFLAGPPARATSPNVETALELVKDMQPDQCALQKVRGKVLAAHQSHDQDALDALLPEMDSLTKKLKSSEEKLRQLTDSFKQNPQDQAAFSAARPAAATCH